MVVQHGHAHRHSRFIRPPDKMSTVARSSAVAAGSPGPAGSPRSSSMRLVRWVAAAMIASRATDARCKCLDGRSQTLSKPERFGALDHRQRLFVPGPGSASSNRPMVKTRACAAGFPVRATPLSGHSDVGYGRCGNSSGGRDKSHRIGVDMTILREWRGEASPGDGRRIRRRHPRHRLEPKSTRATPGNLAR